MGGAATGLLVLGAIRKQSEKSLEASQCGGVPPWPTHQLLPPDSSLAWVPSLTSFNDGP